MCDICWQTPCNPRCPNADEPPVVCLCWNCENEIHDGDDVYKINGELWCEGCIDEARTCAELED